MASYVAITREGNIIFFLLFLESTRAQFKALPSRNPLGTIHRMIDHEATALHHGIHCGWSHETKPHLFEHLAHGLTFLGLCHGILQTSAVPFGIQDGFVVHETPNERIKVIRIVRMFGLEFLNASGIVNDRLNLTLVSHHDRASVGLQEPIPTETERDRTAAVP